MYSSEYNRAEVKHVDRELNHWPTNKFSFPQNHNYFIDLVWWMALFLSVRTALFPWAQVGPTQAWLQSLFAGSVHPLLARFSGPSQPRFWASRVELKNQRQQTAGHWLAREWCCHTNQIHLIKILWLHHFFLLTFNLYNIHWGGADDGAGP